MSAYIMNDDEINTIISYLSSTLQYMNQNWRSKFWTKSQSTKMNKSDYDKEVELQLAYEIIGRLDEGVQSVWIDKAIEKLEQLKHVRENIPF